MLYFVFFGYSTRPASKQLTHLLEWLALGQKCVITKKEKYMYSILYKFIFPLFILNLRKGQNRRK